MEEYSEFESVLVERVGVEVKSSKAEGGWHHFICGARGWNYVNIPASDVLVYVSKVQWNNGHRDVDKLGPPGSHEGVKFGRHQKRHIWLTATTRESAQHYWGHGSGLFSIGLNDYGDDNSGGFEVWIKYLDG